MPKSVTRPLALLAQDNDSEVVLVPPRGDGDPHSETGEEIIDQRAPVRSGLMAADIVGPKTALIMSAQQRPR